MTYPVDDAGNPRVDFVWGNMAMQPDQDRQGRNLNRLRANQDQNTNWVNSLPVGSDDLQSEWSVIPFPTGDGGNGRQQTFTWGINDIATTGYSNFPAFIENYAGNGDAGLDSLLPNISNLSANAAMALLATLGVNFNYTSSFIGATLENDGKLKSQDIPTGAPVSVNDTVNAVYFAAPLVPNVVDFDSLEAAQAYLELNGLVLGNSYSSEVGATSQNNGWIKSQSIASGTKVNAGTAVDLTTYHYVLQPPVNPPATTGPIAGFNRTPASLSLNGDEVAMYLIGRTVRPEVGNVITVSGSSTAYYNQNWNVMEIVNDDAYNTGGTAVKLQRTVFFDMNANPSSSGGTWTKQ